MTERRNRTVPREWRQIDDLDTAEYVEDLEAEVARLRELLERQPLRRDGLTVVCCPSALGWISDVRAALQEASDG